MKQSESNFKVDDFKSIRNYIHNYLGLTKEEVKDIILDEVRKICQEECRKVFNDNEYLENLIKNTIRNTLQHWYNEDKNNKGAYQRTEYVVNTMNKIYSQIDKEIHQIVCSRLLVGLKEPDGNQVYGNDGKVYTTNIRGD